MKGSVSTGQRLAHMASMIAAAMSMGFRDVDDVRHIIDNPYGRNRRDHDRIKNRSNQTRNREERKKIYGDRSPFQAAVNRLTNWERNQWARAGYPGLRQSDIKAVEEFSSVARRRRLEAKARL